MINTLLHTTELLTSEYELQDLVHLLVEKITTAAKVDVCSIRLIDEEANEVVDCYKHSRVPLLEIKINKAVMKEVIGSGKPLVMNDLSEQDLAKYFDGEANVKSFACVPLRIRSKVSGAIEMFYIQKNKISNEELNLLVAFATQVAIAIENTRLLGRSTLLKEAHHRIKNNLQSIISLLNLRLCTQTTKSFSLVVQEIIDRIKTIAAIHEILSQDEKSIG